MIYVSSFVVCKGITLKINDNVLADYMWIRFPFCLQCVVQCGCIKLIFLWIVSLMIFVSSFVVSVGICLTNNDDFSQLTVCAFRSTSVGSASVNVPASNWFAVDRVFQMTFVSSFLTSVGISLTNSGNILQLNVRAFRSTSDNIVWVNVPASDCLTVDWVIRCGFWFQFRDVYRNLSDEQW